MDQWGALGFHTRVMLVAGTSVVVMAGFLISIMLFIWGYGVLEEQLCYPNWRAAYSMEYEFVARSATGVNGKRPGTKSGAIAERTDTSGLLE